MCRSAVGVLLLLTLVVAPVHGAAATPAPKGGAEKVGKFPHVEFYPARKQVRVECEMLGCDAPLEFFCCVKGTNDYEAMIRSEVKPSDLHMALLAIELKPGEPVHYSPALQKWFPPTGPPLHISVEYEKDGKLVRTPAWKWMRDVKTKKTAPPFTWVFTGSQVMPDRRYAADATGYLVTVVNFELSVIDVPAIASSSNELLEWERDPTVTPKKGTKLWMIIEPAGADAPKVPPRGPTTQPTTAGHAQAPARPTGSAVASAGPTQADALIQETQSRVEQLKSQWQQKVAGERDALRQAAESHYQIMADLRREQQKLVDAADKIQRTMDELEKEYQDLTTPHPAKQ